MTIENIHTRNYAQQFWLQLTIENNEVARSSLRGDRSRSRIITFPSSSAFTGFFTKSVWDMSESTNKVGTLTSRQIRDILVVVP